MVTNLLHGYLNQPFFCFHQEQPLLEAHSGI